MGFNWSTPLKIRNERFHVSHCWNVISSMLISHHYDSNPNLALNPTVRIKTQVNWSLVTVQPFWVVLGCAKRWQTAQATVNGRVPSRKVHGSGGVELPAGGDEGSGVVEGVVGAASHPANLVMDFRQVGQLKQEKWLTAQRSPHTSYFNHTFRWWDANRSEAKVKISSPKLQTVLYQM